MPELPEVETIRQQLEYRVVGATIADAGAHWSDKFSSALDAVGGTIVGTRRRGKYLLFDLDLEVPAELVVHLGICLLYTSPSPRDRQKSRMPSSA